MKTTLIADSFFDGQKIRQAVPLTIEDGFIQSFETDTNTKTQRLHGMLVPGFVDVQVNGGGGYLFNQTPTAEAIKAIGLTHAKFGTTGFLPTLITDEISVMQKAADAVSQAIKQKTPGVLGVHFEGPNLSKERKGVHSEKLIRGITKQEIEIFCRQDLGVRVITVAPENVPPDVIRQLVESGARVCLGHSDANYETTRAALTAGATGFTHLFNAMSRLQSREPGMVGAALEDVDSWCGLIVDGHHVHPATMKIALAAKQPGKLMLVTDAMSLLGTDQLSIPFFDMTIYRDNDRLNVESGMLAGSMLDMATAVRNAVQMLAISKEEALRMASLYPVEFLGLQKQFGSLETGKAANLVLLDEQLSVKATWIAGNQVH